MHKHGYIGLLLGVAVGFYLSIYIAQYTGLQPMVPASLNTGG
jgi:ABC-type lipoprotein release transport system permease subunit